jgi:hypothetical protein
VRIIQISQQDDDSGGFKAAYRHHCALNQRAQAFIKDYFSNENFRMSVEAFLNKNDMSNDERKGC